MEYGCFRYKKPLTIGSFVFPYFARVVREHGIFPDFPLALLQPDELTIQLSVSDYPSIWFAHTTIYTVLEGAGSYRKGVETVDFSPGTTFYIAPQVPHQFLIDVCTTVRITAPSIDLTKLLKRRMQHATSS